VPHAWFLWLITLLLSLLSFFLFFWPDATAPPFFVYLFAKSVRNSLFLKRKSTQGKARVGHTNALFKCTFNLSLSCVCFILESEATDGVPRSLLSFLPRFLLLLEMKRKVKHLSGRWRVKERRKFSPFCARAFFFFLSVCELLEARDARDRLEYRQNDF